MKAVVAIGGNALLPPTGMQRFEEQLERVKDTSKKLKKIIDRCSQTVITHGNGTQVGNLVLQEERTPPKFPLDVDVAETQGQIGYLLQREIGKNLEPEKELPVTIITQTVVEEDSDEFKDPSKPVGPFYSKEEARDKEGTIRKIGGGDKPYRRVFPSPRPIDIVEKKEIETLLSNGNPVIACGGGGIPVKKSGEGVEAVVDKDKASALLAKIIDADILVVLTDVNHVYRNFGSENEEPIEETSPSDIKEMIDKGQFGEGSMKPKVEAAAQFVQSTGNRAVIGNMEDALKAFEGKGTVVKPEEG